jgi:hypothetical protein
LARSQPTLWRNVLRGQRLGTGLGPRASVGPPEGAEAASPAVHTEESNLGRTGSSPRLLMSFTKSQENLTRSGPASSATASRALEWLWQHLPEVRSPHVLDCGPVFQPTLDLFLRRGAKVYVADLITLALRADSPYWSQVGKTPVFLIEEFLAQLPPIPLESLSAVFCWHLLDLLPRDVLPRLVGRLFSYLKPAGVLFCLLREPYLAAGAETSWGLAGLTGLASGTESSKLFAYPALTNREMERLVPGGNVKTFLTRAGRREVLGIK